MVAKTAFAFGRDAQAPICNVAGTIHMLRTETEFLWDQTMYYVAPASCMFLSVPFFALEAPRLAKVGMSLVTWPTQVLVCLRTCISWCVAKKCIPS